MNGMPMASGHGSAVMTVAMMAAMMLPSFAPAIRRSLRFAMGHLIVWSAGTACVLYVDGREAPHVGAGLAAIAVIAALLLQGLSRHYELPSRTSLLDGMRFGISCALRCSGSMLLLTLVGLMNLPVMLAMMALPSLRGITRSSPDPRAPDTSCLQASRRTPS